MAQNRGAALFDQLPGLGLVIGTQKFHQVSDLLHQTKDNNRVIDLSEEEVTE